MSELDKEKYTASLLVLFNKEAECEIGDNIIWLNHGNLYAFSKSEEANLPALKREKDDNRILIAVPSDSYKRTTISSVDARYQTTFTQLYYQPC